MEVLPSLRGSTINCLPIDVKHNHNQINVPSISCTQQVQVGGGEGHDVSDVFMCKEIL